MNALLYTQPVISCYLVLAGCILGTPLWIIIGRIWAQKQEPQ